MRPTDYQPPSIFRVQNERTTGVCRKRFRVAGLRKRRMYCRRTPSPRYYKGLGSPGFPILSTVNAIYDDDDAFSGNRPIRLRNETLVTRVERRRGFTSSRNPREA